MNFRRPLSWLCFAATVAIAGIVAFNVADYIRFHRAISRVESLAPVQLTSLANFGRQVAGHFSYRENEIPRDLQILKPIEVHAMPSLTDIHLYSTEQAYVMLRIKTSAHNQQIFLWINSHRGPISKRLWVRNPDLEKEVSPDGRLLTIALWTLNESYDWIVLSDRICVVQRTTKIGRGDELEASTPLEPDSRNHIEALIREIPTSIRGKEFNTGAADGAHLVVKFAPNGEDDPNDIALRNAWVEELRPLLSIISIKGPKDFPIPYARYLTPSDNSPRQPFQIRTLEESRLADDPPPKTPFWGIWRKFLD